MKKIAILSFGFLVLLFASCNLDFLTTDANGGGENGGSTEPLSLSEQMVEEYVQLAFETSGERTYFRTAVNAYIETEGLSDSENLDLLVAALVEGAVTAAANETGGDDITLSRAASWAVRSAIVSSTVDDRLETYSVNNDVRDIIEAAVVPAITGIANEITVQATQDNGVGLVSQRAIQGSHEAGADFTETVSAGFLAVSEGLVVNEDSLADIETALVKSVAVFLNTMYELWETQPEAAILKSNLELVLDQQDRADLEYLLDAIDDMYLEPMPAITGTSVNGTSGTATTISESGTVELQVVAETAWDDGLSFELQQTSGATVVGSGSSTAGIYTASVVIEDAGEYGFRIIVRNVGGNREVVADFSVDADIEVAELTPSQEAFEAGMTHLLADEVSAAYTEFERALTLDASNEQASLMLAYLDLAFIAVEPDVVSLMQNHLGVIGYPSDIDELMGEEWLAGELLVPEYDEVADETVWVAKPFPEINVPAWFEPALLEEGQTEVELSLYMLPMVAVANVIDNNPAGLNNVLDMVLDGVFGVQLDAAISAVDALEGEVVVEADGLEFTDLELRSIKGMLLINKSLLQYTNSYSYDYPYNDFMGLDWGAIGDDGFSSDMLNDITNPFSTNFLSDRGQGHRDAAKATMIDGLQTFSALLQEYNEQLDEEELPIADVTWEILELMADALQTGASVYEDEEGNLHAEDGGDYTEIIPSAVFDSALLTLDNMFVTDGSGMPEMAAAMYVYDGDWDFARFDFTPELGTFAAFQSQVESELAGWELGDISEIDFYIGPRLDLAAIVQPVVPDFPGIPEDTLFFVMLDLGYIIRIDIDQSEENITFTPNGEQELEGIYDNAVLLNNWFTN